MIIYFAQIICNFHCHSLRSNLRRMRGLSLHIYINIEFRIKKISGFLIICIFKYFYKHNFKNTLLPTNEALKHSIEDIANLFHHLDVASILIEYLFFLKNRIY